MKMKEIGPRGNGGGATPLCVKCQPVCACSLRLLHFLHFNPYAADQIFVPFRYMPSVTKLLLLNFIHMLPSVTNVSDTKVTQSFPKFANIFNIVNLL